MSGLNAEWRRRIDNSPEAKKAKQNLEFHRQKMHRMHEEMSRAEDWEKELERRLKNLEEKVKPPILILEEHLVSPKPVDDSIIDASINEGEPERLISLLRRKAKSMQQMDRSELLCFVKTTIGVRNAFLEKDNKHGVDVMQDIASGVLKQLGRRTINWQDLTPWEANFMKMIILEVDGVPGFIVKFMEQVLTHMGSQGQNGMDTNSENLSNSGQVVGGPGVNNNSHVRRNLNFTENQTTSAYSNTSTPIN